MKEKMDEIKKLTCFFKKGIKKNIPEIIDLMEEMKDSGEQFNTRKELICYCSSKGKLKIIKLLIEKMDISTLYNQGILINAAFNGDLEMVQYLIDKGLNVNEKTEIGSEDALSYSAERGHTEIVRLLVKNGANIHIHNDKPLRLSLEKGHLEIVKLLLDNGSDLYSKGGIPIRMCMRNHHFHVMEYLIENNLDVSYCELVGDQTAQIWFEKYMASKEFSNKLSQDLNTKKNVKIKIKI